MSPDFADCPPGVKSPWVLNHCFILEVKDKTENTLAQPRQPPYPTPTPPPPPAPAWATGQVSVKGLVLVGAACAPV